MGVVMVVEERLLSWVGSDVVGGWFVWRRRGRRRVVVVVMV
jgi:hypothetical protein